MILFLLPLLFYCSPGFAESSDSLANTLKIFAEGHATTKDGLPLLSNKLLDLFYAQRDYKRVWVNPVQINSLLQVIEGSQADGFELKDFRFDLIQTLAAPSAWENLSESARNELDLQLTDALLRYVHHTRFGKLDPVAIDPKNNDRAPIPAELLINDLQKTLVADDLKIYLNSRFKIPFWYENLKIAYRSYAALAKLGKQPPLAMGAKLAKGSRGPRVAELRERLKLIGEYSEKNPTTDPALFDDSLRTAVINFQRHLGVNPDGIVGTGTVNSLNHPYDENKLFKMRINLERMRWLYNDLPADYILVDIANFMAYVIRADAIVWSTRVIVGALDTQTPMFRDNMDHLIFNPTWTVPISIQKTMKTVSALYTLVDRQNGHRSDGGYAGNYQRYRVIQKPGPKNALGRVKFIFPNRHSVYLHDTPSKSLFARSMRALSHGCIRVQNPTRLAEVLLAQPTWDQAKIARVLETNQTRSVNLPHALPVLLYYLTARADEAGHVSFRPDIYGRDQTVKDAFNKPVIKTRIVFPDEPVPVKPKPKTDEEDPAP